MDTYLLADAFEVLLRGGGIVLGWILLVLGARSGLRRFHRLTSVPLGSGAPVRFCLVDFLALFVLLQIPLLILKLAIDSVGRATPALLFWCGCYSLVYVGLWWWSAASLSAAGISNTLRRGVFLALLLPASLGLLLLALPAAILAPIVIVGGDWQDALLALGGMGAYGLVCWCYSRAIGWVTWAPPSQAARDVSPFPHPSQVFDGTD